MELGRRLAKAGPVYVFVWSAWLTLGFSGNSAFEIYVLYCHLYVALFEPNKYLLLILAQELRRQRHRDRDTGGVAASASTREGNEKGCPPPQPTRGLRSVVNSGGVPGGVPAENCFGAFTA